nr:hypothetical protein GCM10020092_031870 [Actinoplanes digitatis]
MYDRGQVRDGVDHRGQAGPVGRVAGRDGDPLAQLGGELGRAGRVRAAAAEQHQVPGAGRGEPPGDPGTEGAGATGDQDRAVRVPLAGRAFRYRGEAAAEYRGGPDGDLVLALRVGQHRGEAGGRAGVERLRQIDQAAPALRVLQRGDATETVHAGL